MEMLELSLSYSYYQFNQKNNNLKKKDKRSNLIYIHTCIYIQYNI